MDTILPVGVEVSLTIKITVGPWMLEKDGDYVRRWSGPPDDDGTLPEAARVSRVTKPWPFKPRWSWMAGDPYGDNWAREGEEKGPGPEAALSAADTALVAVASEIQQD